MTSQNVLERLGPSCRKCRTSFPSPSGIWESLNLEYSGVSQSGVSQSGISQFGISQSPIWNLESRIFGRLHDGGDNARRSHDPRIATHRKHLHTRRSNAGRTPTHAVLAWLSPTWGSFRCAFSQVDKLRFGRDPRFLTPSIVGRC